ncbi:MAG TPA: Ig-like domain-containing protein, partial [Gemmatimonadaceae bacterium]|nr:Ig-like domain-containing protein [Gemmatimonadaceae bacterium]
RPSVIVRDEAGNPLAGVTVVFTITGGDGSLAGSTVTTGGTGVATVSSWMLGQTASTNTVQATVTGLSPVTFTANAGDPCLVTPAYSIGAAGQGKLSLADCQVSDGSFVDFYRVTIPAMAMYQFNQNSSAIDSYLLLLTTDYHVIATNDNLDNSTHNSMVRAILPPGDFLIGANSLNGHEVGAYDLTSVSLAQQQVSNCEDMFTVPGITTNQSLQTTDCNQSGFYSDDYIIFLNTGQTLTVTMTSSAIDPYLELYALQGAATLVASNDDADATTKNSSITYTATSLGYYFVKARTTTAATTGAYTITTQ